MLARCRAAKLPILSRSTDVAKLEAHVRMYDKLLLGMPTLMNMQREHVRPHLIRKHMLAATAGSVICVSILKIAGLRCMAPDMCQALLEIPSWLPPRKLAAQLQCKPELLSMWFCLWKDALELDGALAALFNDAHGIRQVLDQYVLTHGYPPSPYTLMRAYLKVPSLVADVSADTMLPVAKRRCTVKTAAGPSSTGHANRPPPDTSLPSGKVPATAGAPPCKFPEATAAGGGALKHIRGKARAKAEANAFAKGEATAIGMAKVRGKTEARAKAKAKGKAIARVRSKFRQAGA